MAASNTDQGGSAASGGGSSVGIKETFTSLVIALALAFIFRGFVVEGFVIPTGSMAPTLLGKHVRFTGESNGYSWTTGPWDYAARGIPSGIQGRDRALEPTDPMTGLDLGPDQTVKRKLASGDRVFVLKYLPVIHRPERWDVVVFKNPGTHENYIKRLVGLPGEQLAIVDGDIFTRPFVEGETSTGGWDSWNEPGWRVARKNERVQRAMLQDVFNSRYAPAAPNPSFRTPWDAQGAGWSGVADSTVYTYEGAGDAELVWDNGVIPLSDRNSYNQVWPRFDPRAMPGDLATPVFPSFWVSDLALSSDFVLGTDSATIEARIQARGLEFKGVYDGSTGSVRVLMREAPGDDAEGESQPAEVVQGGEWSELDAGSGPRRGSGERVSVELWHMDQALWMFIDGELVCGGPEDGAYELNPIQTAEHATGMTPEALRSDPYGDGVTEPGVLANPNRYRASGVRWSVRGGAFEMHNVSVRRDIAYRNMPPGQHVRPTRGGHPDFFPTLTDEEYFMCGDNSARSEDSRLWSEGSIVPWVKDRIDDRVGVVHEDLIVGKAFVVYWPSMVEGDVMVAPDVGRVRWIW